MLRVSTFFFQVKKRNFQKSEPHPRYIGASVLISIHGSTFCEMSNFSVNNMKNKITYLLTQNFKKIFRIPKKLPAEGFFYRQNEIRHLKKKNTGWAPKGERRGLNVLLYRSPYG